MAQLRTDAVDFGHSVRVAFEPDGSICRLIAPRLHAPIAAHPYHYLRPHFAACHLANLLSPADTHRLPKQLAPEWALGGRGLYME